MLTVVITIMREVADQVEANVFYDIAKEKALEYPNVRISGLTSNHFAQETSAEEPS